MSPRACRRSPSRTAFAVVSLLTLAAAAAFVPTGRSDAQGATAIQVDVAADRRPIDPRVYGVSFAEPAQLAALNVPLNRWGGNATTRHNWKQNGDNRGSDWYFESIPGTGAPGAAFDDFVAKAKANGAEPMVTIPLIGWVGKNGPNGTKLASFSAAKYGAQQDCDWSWFPDACNGILAGGEKVTGNDPNDASTPSSAAYQKEWAQHLVSKWGPAASGGVRYYIYDNEPSLWHSTHRDVHPTGARMTELRDLMVAYGTAIRQADPGAVLVGPEEWGWTGYFWSGYDQQYNADHGCWSCSPDKTANGGTDYLPWLLAQLRAAEQATGTKLLDVFTVHYYPQGGEYWGGTSAAEQALRNRSTRSLWDPSYTDESWIADRVQLIPRMKQWVAARYPGLETGITEYNWGAEDHINGATAQADVLGIFGREGLSLATRWTTPSASSVSFKAIQMYRNYDGRKSTFGDVSVRATGPNPDSLAVFAAQRSADGAATVMAINKVGTGALVNLGLANFTAGAAAQVWQLTSANAISRLADVPVSGGALTTTLAPQSVTLFVVPPGGTAPPSLSVGDVALSEGHSGTQSATFTVSLSASSSQTITVGYATADGSATAGSDYTATSGTLTFAAGQTSKTVAVPVAGDTAIEADEAFTLSLSGASGATIARATGTATIRNDDFPSLSVADVTVVEGNSGTTSAVFTVSLSAAAPFPVSVSYATANGTATAGSDYGALAGSLSLAAGQTTKTIAVVVNGDTTVEANETFTMTLSGASGATIARATATGTIANDDTAAVPTLSIGDATVAEGNAGTTVATFAVTLSASSASTVTVAFATANGTATAGSDYVAQSGTLTFTAGQTTKAIAVVVNGDTAVEPNESFTVTLSGAGGATIARATGTGTITNDDTAALPSLSINDVTVVEGNAGTRLATFTVALSGVSASAVTVAYATANGTAGAGSDYVAQAGTLTFAAGQTARTIAVVVKGDRTVEPNETFNVRLSAASGATIARGTAVGTIANDDFRGRQVKAGWW